MRSADEAGDDGNDGDGGLAVWMMLVAMLGVGILVAVAHWAHRGLCQGSGRGRDVGGFGFVNPGYAGESTRAADGDLYAGFGPTTGKGTDFATYDFKEA